VVGYIHLKNFKDLFYKSIYIEMSSDPDHLYLDLAIINNDNKGNQTKTNLNFTELRNNPFLSNPNNYYLGICRFEVDTPGFSLPIFIPVLLLDGQNTNENKTIYTITMGTIGGSPTKLNSCFSVNVEWRPEDLTAAQPLNQRTLDNKGVVIPGSPYTKQNITTGYYNCYSIKWWLNCVNKALTDCWVGAGFGLAATAPYLINDPNTNLITLYTPLGFAAQSTDSNAIGEDYPVFLNSNLDFAMFFNEPLFNLFSAFPSVFFGAAGYNLAAEVFDAPSYALYVQKPYLFNYYVQPINYNGLNIITPEGPESALCVTPSNYSPVPMWNPVSQLVFSTALLPISVSLTNVPTVFNSNTFDLTYSQSGNNANVNSMLTDIELGLTTGTETKPSILYIPKNEYRLVDLFGNNPINQASFSISWKTKYGVSVPFRLSSQCGANIKLLFRRKRYDLLNLPPYNSN